MSRTPSVLPEARSVAVVGASTLGGKNYYGSRLMANLVDAESEVTIYPVNPRLAGQTVMGRPVSAGLRDLPTVPDLVVVVTGTSAVPAVLTDAGEIGARTCLVISNELGGHDAKAHFRAEIRGIATRYGMRVIGPNSMGVLCGTTMLNASFASGAHDGGLKAGGLGMVAQSGSAISYLLESNRERTGGYSWLISTGDEAASSLESLFEAVVDDPATTVVLLFIEGIADGDRFRRAAARAAELGKPVVMLQVGVSDVGRAAVHSHTGRLAGAQAAFDAVGAESGLLRVGTFDELFTVGRVLTEQTVPRRDRPHGRRVCVLTSSGGTGSYAADHFRQRGWTVPPLRADLRVELESAVGQYDLQNPVDVTGSWANPELLPTALAILARDREVDAFVVATGAGGTLAAPVATALAQARIDTDAELYVAWAGASRQVQQILDASAFTVVTDVAVAAAAAEASAVYRDRRRGTPGGSLVGAHRDADRRRQPDGRSASWTAATTLQSLQAHGVSCVPTVVVSSRSREKVLAAATEVGYPVTVKIDSPDLVHKIDKGGVAVGIDDAARLHRHLDEFDAVIADEKLSDPRIIVQGTAAGTEIFAGIRHDPVFGHLLVVGAGGTYVELLDATQTVLLPTTTDHLDAVLRGHPVLGRLLNGYRTRRPPDTGALIEVIRRFADWATDPTVPLLLEADLNPIFVTERGAAVVDARSVWSRT